MLLAGFTPWPGLPQLLLILNHKYQNRLVKYIFFSFFSPGFRKLTLFCLRPPSALKLVRCMRPFARKGCAPLLYLIPCLSLYLIPCPFLCLMPCPSLCLIPCSLSTSFLVISTSFPVLSTSFPVFLSARSMPVFLRI